MPMNSPYGLNLKPELIKQFNAMVAALYKLCVDYDCSLVEINPLVLTSDNRVIALDGKINFDDNALYRHKDIVRNTGTLTKRIPPRLRLPSMTSTTSTCRAEISATW